mmetsp:Transcript_16229/g.49381  ORF Transcript_16229/g.49381 Transcript_16229/m.49381 type:complete len:170 (-) Transcript_16229:56-565(-)
MHWSFNASQCNPQLGATGAHAAAAPLGEATQVASAVVDIVNLPPSPFRRLRAVAPLSQPCRILQEGSAFPRLPIIVLHTTLAPPTSECERTCIDLSHFLDAFISTFTQSPLAPTTAGHTTALSLILFVLIMCCCHHDHNTQHRYDSASTLLLATSPLDACHVLLPSQPQ